MKIQKKIINGIGILMGIFLLGIAISSIFTNYNTDDGSVLMLGGIGILFIILPFSPLGDVDINSFYYKLLGLDKNMSTAIPENQNKINPTGMKISFVILLIAVSIVPAPLTLYIPLPKNIFALIFPLFSIIGIALFYKSGGYTATKDRLKNTWIALLGILLIFAITLSIYKTWDNPPFGLYDLILIGGWISLFFFYKSIRRNMPSSITNAYLAPKSIRIFLEKYEFLITLAFGILVTAIIAGLLIFAPDLV